MLAFVLTCSALLSSGSAAFAATETAAGETEEATSTEETSETAVMETQIAIAEDIEILQGEAFEVELDFKGITLHEKESIAFREAVREDSKEAKFDVNQPGTYRCVYQVTTANNETYEIARNITVTPRESETAGQEQGTKDSGSDEEGEADSERESEEKSEEVSENGVFLAVVPESAQYSRASATLVKGDNIYYPSDLGDYLTAWFHVNGKIAYCVESNKSSPPSSDYVANVYESNLQLQKVLYYGYGGPGDLTGTYLKKYDDSVKYILTHLAASYAYAGAEVAFTGCYQSGLETYGVMDYINHLYSQDAPPKAALNLTPEKLNAYESGDMQRTDKLKLTGDKRNYVTLSLPKDVTYHSGSDSTTGGKVKISGGTSFYFGAPKTVTGTWKSGTLKGQMGTQWKTLVVSTGGTTQDISYGDFYDEPESDVSFSVKWMDLAKIEIIKSDGATNVNLAGAVFGIYADKDCKTLIKKMPATDAKGASEVEIAKTQDTVYLKEISVPSGYKLSTAVSNVKLEAGKTTTKTISNDEQKGKITVKKTGEVLTGVAGEEGSLTFNYSSAPFEGAQYKIYAAEDIVSQDGKTKIHASGDLVDSLTTGTEGTAVSKDLYLGKYKVVEEKAPTDLVIGKTEADRTKYVTLSYAGQTAELAAGEVSYINDRPDVQVKVVKKSENDGVTLKDAIFGLYAAEDIKAKDGTVLVKEGTLIEQTVSDIEGLADFKADIPVNYSYVIKEIQAPPLYFMSTDSYEFNYIYKDDKTYTYTFEHTFSNKEVRGEVHLSKIDIDAQDYISQGDASLDGAVYGLYAAEDIQHPNGKTGTVYKKDELVAQGTIKDGKADFVNLYLAHYYAKEISPGEGYLLDETSYPVNVGYEGQEVAIVHRNVTVKEKVKKQAFELIKITEDGEQTETDLVENAGFKIFLISQLKGVQDGSLKPANGSTFVPEDFINYDYSHDETASYYEDGEKIIVDELFTDKKGYLCTPEIPYGAYVVFESTTPKDLQTVNPFLVTINEDSREPQPWRIFDDRPIQFYFKIVKEDAQTHLPVLENHAKYKIFDVDKGEYVTMKVRYPEVQTIDVFETNDEGYLQTPEQLKMGTYRIEEVEAPALFVQPGFEKSLVDGETMIPLNQISTTGVYQEAPREAITITVDSNTAHEVEEGTGKYIVVVHQENDEAVGSLTIKKTGEFLTGVKAVGDNLIEKAKNGLANAVNAVSEFFGGQEVIERKSGYSFTYENGPAAGIKFSLFAAETIYTPDGQKDEAGNRVILFEKDALIAELVTGEDGNATLNNLPVGKFYVQETDAGEHNFVLDPEKKEFEITYQGQEVAVDYVSMEVENQRQRVDLELVKVSKATKVPIEGAVFGLYAEEDILNVTGDVVVKAGELIAQAESDADGKVVFDADLPNGKFFAKELEAAPGYLLSEETWSFDAMYNPELEVISLKKEIENQPTIVEISKTDITDDKEVEGAKLQIRTEDGEVVEEWISSNEPHFVYALQPNKYILHEEAAPNGYLIVSDVPFTVEQTGEIQKVSMKDERPVGQLVIKKVDAENNAPLEGVEFEIRNKVTKEVVGKLVTGKDGTAKSEELPAAVYENGKYVEPIVYVLVETKPLEGYEANGKEEEIVFTYQDDKTKIIEVTKEIKNNRKPGVEAPAAPKTGDTTNFWIPIAAAIFAAIGILMVGIRMKRRKRKNQ